MKSDGPGWPLIFASILGVVAFFIGLAIQVAVEHRTMLSVMASEPVTVILLAIFVGVIIVKIWQEWRHRNRRP
jgi:hypothetical protein